MCFKQNTFFSTSSTSEISSFKWYIILISVRFYFSILNFQGAKVFFVMAFAVQYLEVDGGIGCYARDGNFYSEYCNMCFTNGLPVAVGKIGLNAKICANGRWETVYGWTGNKCPGVLCKQISVCDIECF